MDFVEKAAWLYGSDKEYDGLFQSHWERIRDIHFNENTGTEYWLNKSKEEGIDPRNDLDTVNDFMNSRLSLCDEGAFKERPVRYFLPKSLQNNLNGDVKVYASSGSVNNKKEVPWDTSSLDYSADYANYCFDRLGVRRDIDWIVQGPYGIFQDVIRKELENRGALVHSAGLETRNIKKAFASVRSMEDFQNNQFLQTVMGPAIEFTQDTLAKEKIGGMVTAIQMLPAISRFKGFENIEAIYLSGMEIPKGDYDYWKGKLSNVKFVHSFGHHNLGFSYSTPFEDEPYFPPSPLSQVYIVDRDDPFTSVGYGSRGRHKILRMSPSLLWSQLDRDYSTRIAHQEEFRWDGFKDVRPTFEKNKVGKNVRTFLV
jgi:hypothetical protein